MCLQAKKAAVKRTRIDITRSNKSPFIARHMAAFELDLTVGDFSPQSRVPNKAIRVSYLLFSLRKANHWPTDRS